MTTVTYDDKNLYSEIINPLGQKASYDYDKLGRMFESTKYERQNGQYVKASVTTLQYDGWGNITSITDPNGNVAGNPDWEHRTLYEYDSMGQNSAIIYPDETQNLSDNAKQVMNIDYASNKKTIFDEEGHKSEEYYDMQGRVVRQVIYNDSQEIVIEIYYDGLGNNVITIDPKEQKTVSKYNNLNLLEKITYPKETFWENGREVTVSPYIRSEYNQTGQKVKDIVSLPEEREQETKYEVDGIGRVIRSTVRYSENGVSNEAVSEIYYDPMGNKVKVVDANNTPLLPVEQKAYTYTYSAINLLLSETDPLGNTTSYIYDDAGNRISMTDARGNSGKYDADFTIIYEYDDLHRLVKGYLPKSVGDLLKPVVALKYDAKGNLIERTEPDGNKTIYTYYPRNWVKTATVEGSGKTYSTKH